MKRRLAMWAGTVVVLAMAACAGGATTEDVTVLDGDVESLRAAFDADSGRVRAIFLASPT